MFKTSVRVALLGAVFLLAACKDNCQSFSKYTCKELEKTTYNVWFYYRTGNPIFAGATTGLENCRSMAKSYAEANTRGGSGWSYSCCVVKTNSTCEERHK